MFCIAGQQPPQNEEQHNEDDDDNNDDAAPSDYDISPESVRIVGTVTSAPRAITQQNENENIPSVFNIARPQSTSQSNNNIPVQVRNTRFHEI